MDSEQISLIIETSNSKQKPSSKSKAVFNHKSYDSIDSNAL